VSGVDPITLQVIGHAFASISDEMNAALVRTSYSTNIKDRRDCSAAVLSPNGELIAQSAFGTPLHLGVLPYSVRHLLSLFPAQEMAHGDHYICNLPYPAGPGHLNDVTVVSPVVYDDCVVAVVACTAHHVDVGGGAPGSMPFGVTEIFQEGLQIPPLAICRKGELNEDLVALILQNVRTRGEFRGDLMAQLAANNVGAARVRSLLEDRGATALSVYVPALFDYSERLMRAALSELPEGSWTYEDHIEGDGIDSDLVTIRATVTIQDGELSVDFSATDDQVRGPLNCRPPSAIACVYYVALALAGGSLRGNHGLFRPIHTVTRPGSLLEAIFPAAVCNANIVTTQRIVDVLLGALSSCAPEKVCAACSGTMNLFNIGGLDPGRGIPFNYIETYGGGQGALPDRDGGSAIHTHMSNTRNASIEQIEQTYPMQVLGYRLVENSEGAGKFRGGFGLERELEILGEGMTLTLSSDRHQLGPWGLDAGLSGQPGECLLTHDGSTERLSSKVTRAIDPGSVVVSRTPGGGGRGDPFDRVPAFVGRDVLNGYISSERAFCSYGVICDSGGAIDEDATREHRLSVRQQSPPSSHSTTINQAESNEPAGSLPGIPGG
jgi:N-methylhydantoinase B